MFPEHDFPEVNCDGSLCGFDEKKKKRGEKSMRDLKLVRQPVVANEKRNAANLNADISQPIHCSKNSNCHRFGANTTQGTRWNETRNCCKFGANVSQPTRDNYHQIRRESKAKCIRVRLRGMNFAGLELIVVSQPVATKSKK